MCKECADEREPADYVFVEIVPKIIPTHPTSLNTCNNHKL